MLHLLLEWLAGHESPGRVLAWIVLVLFLLVVLGGGDSPGPGAGR